MHTGGDVASETGSRWPEVWARLIPLGVLSSGQTAKPHRNSEEGGLSHPHKSLTPGYMKSEDCGTLSCAAWTPTYDPAGGFAAPPSEA